MTDDLHPLVLARYLDGSATPVERAEVERWLAADAARPAAMAELRAAWARGDRTGVYDAQAAWASVRRAVVPAPAARQFTVRPSHRVAPWLAAAASIALVVGAGVWTLDRMPASSPPAAVAMTTAAGELRTLRLPDGTSATLGANSRLVLDPEFGEAERRVDVTGAVFFQVAHDTTRPFRVRAGNAETTVLGTEFSVWAYADEPAVEVVVKSGRVAFGAAESRSGSARPAVLRPGERGRLTADGDVAVGAVDAERYLSWTTGWLDFSDVPLRDAIRDLNRWYGLNLAVDDPQLAARRIIKRFGPADRAAIVRSLAGLVDAVAVAEDDRTLLRPIR